MNTSSYSFSKQSLVRIGWSLIIIGIIVASSFAYATASPDVDTNDGVVDLNWSSPLYSNADCSKTEIPDVDEIRYAWFQNNGSQVFMRFEMCSSSAISDGSISVLVMDCNQDGLYKTYADRLLTYNPQYDYVDLKDGTYQNSWKYCGETTPPDNPPCDYGERVPAAPDDNTLEYRVDYSIIPNETGSAFPPSCRDDPVNIMFGILNTNTGAETDKSGWYQWSVPAVVDIKSINASSQSDLDFTGWVLSGLLVAVGFGLLIVTKRKNSQ